MNIGHLYDMQVADTYDEDSFGLLAGARAMSLTQIQETGLPDNATVLDLGVGTGETLAALAAAFPRGRKIGIDLSERMIEVAKRKVEFEAYVDDAANVAAYVTTASVDLILMHFLTTFVNRPSVFRTAASRLRPGGMFSVVSTPSEAFPNIRTWVAALIGHAAVQAASPGPLTADVLLDELREAGFVVEAFRRFRRRVTFQTFEQVIHWGKSSGFLTHAIEAVGPEVVTALSKVSGVFPLEDEYVGVAVLASIRKSSATSGALNLAGGQ